MNLCFIQKPYPIGAKGMREIALVGFAAALANAVFNATGKRVRELPITPDKLIQGGGCRFPSLEGWPLGRGGLVYIQLTTIKGSDLKIWGFRLQNMFQHLLRLCVTIFLLKCSKKDFHCYPPAFGAMYLFSTFIEAKVSWRHEPRRRQQQRVQLMKTNGFDQEK